MLLLKKDESEVSWAIVYDKAIREDGSLFFPERLTTQFLSGQRRTLGSYIFANQYQNEIIPDGGQDFKKDWLKYYEKLPERKTTFCFIDPAISLEDQACFTAFVVVHIDHEGTWFVQTAKRAKLTATQTVKLVFDLNKIFKPNAIGIETVAYQKALVHFIDDEMRRTGIVAPVIGINRGPDVTKAMRIRSLVPRFEWGRVYLNKGLVDLEDEYSKFPRGQFVDILDALASIEDIAHSPGKERKVFNVPSINSKDYERWYIQQLTSGKARTGQTEED